MLIIQIILGAMMVVITTMIQGVFMFVGIRRLREYAPQRPRKSMLLSTLRIAVFVLWLFLATILEVWSWATLYLALGVFGSIEEATYFSTVTFTTLGYGDITLDDWRLLSSFEAANGLLMFGWSTALVFVAVQWIYESDNKPTDEDA